MISRWFIAATLLLAPWPAYAQTAGSDTVDVAPPTGEREADRASIQSAIEELEPGGTLQFAAGTYLVGERIRVALPGVTILGHPAGTTLRGCEPSELERRERSECMGLELTGGRQTVRGLTFEHARFDLILGCCTDPGEVPPSADPGGYLVEDNTFRASGTSVRVIAGPSETTVIRGNRFRDVFHAVGVNRGTVHIIDNDVSAPHPERFPEWGPGGAITVSHWGQAACDGHVIAGNRIEDHPSAIVLIVRDPDTPCHGHVVRDNTIVVRRAHFTDARSGILVGSQADSTVVGVPIAVVNLVGSGNQPSAPAAAGRGGEAVIGDHLIEGNRVMGAEGIGIEIRGSSGNRIVDNVVTGIEPRDPFPGNVANSADPAAWRAANGSGIWISPGSEDNEIVGNTFEDVAGAEVFLEGDRNRVELRSSSDRVRDLGTGNRVTGPGSSTEDLRRDEPLYDSKFVETRGIRLQYMDFGGTGLPVIFLQDFHNYFDPEWDSEWPGFYARFADAYRVLAPIRRGYGESDDTGWGYDVATQSEDLLGLMDALGIRRAVLIGRQPANQDMTWIAEHHPERVAGLVYMGNPLVFPDMRNPLVRTFEEMTWRSCDLGERSVPIVGPRAAWRPDFLHDEHARLDMPALRFVSPWDTRTVALRVLPGIAATGVNSRCDDEARREYFAALAADEEHVAAIRQALEEADLFPALDRAMERAFGVNLRTEVDDLPKRDGWGATHEFYEPHMRRFLDEVAGGEAARQPPRPDLH